MTRLSSLLSLLLLVGLSSAFVFFPKTQNIKPTFLSATEEKSVDTVLELLEKRLKDGSLTDKEKNIALIETESLLKHLDHVASAPQYTETQLKTAVSNMDADAISHMLQSGLEMDEETTDAAFWTVINAINTAEAQDMPLSANVTQMIHHIFEADHRHLLTREKQTTNLTCMQPDDSQGVAGAARKMNYIFDDGDHKNLPLTEGRRCEGGTCCEECSRNIFPTFATDEESNLETFPELVSLTFNDLEKTSAATIVQFVRLVERVRRTIAHEYGLPLSTILPLQAYSRKYVAGTTQKGGGGGEGDFVTLHTDEATHSGYHYSCVIYLSTQGKDFEGGNFVFNDPADESEETASTNVQEDEEENLDDVKALFEALQRGEELPDTDMIVPGVDDLDPSVSLEELEDNIRKAGRSLTPFRPTRGAAVIFSSGWENMHEVEKITSGVRYAVPAFFTTCPVPDQAYEQMNVGKPKTNEDIADDWLHLLLAHRKEEPIESVGRVKELLMKWHYMCTPLSEH
mmetsp:Transcript_4395/g.5607  ORF Transcript_4395/g.5607 Transcript_4395/m.5607 type:complete len:514 (+) Transcript_4395:62-1603(+)|eukprot:CAMPEP_0172495392 /NCGR_PEP_ID=MMETSP1066-20121228/69601_1 /TAXON_ID=671091 /ORGANISM="Coscinodiscus wailesii, Strain CCMP2513" /LENGTH=513 /DNA_ID=CAMNT_0013267027 /DNA_START=55 /DNA_END=1596 /DNA_ORIENTATION=-